MNRGRTWLMYEAGRRARRGESLRAIARALDIDRRTVAKLLKEAEHRRQQGDDALVRELGPQRIQRPSKLDPYKAFIAEQVSRFPDLRATSLLDRLRERGFDGGYTIVREYLKQARPKPTRQADHLVEHLPGKQAQSDWSEYDLADGSSYNAWATVLSFSKYAYEFFTSDRTQLTVFRQIQRAFDVFDGIPEEMVFDSMPGVVDRWEMEEPIINLKMLDFAAFYGFALHIAPRGEGKYKGIVERQFLTTEQSLLNGRSFASLEEANAARAIWLDRINRRIHGTTRRRPIDLLERDREQMQPIPPRPYDTRDLAYRLVDSYGRVHFETNRYTVPPSYVGHWVYVRADEVTVEIFDGQANRLAQHERVLPGTHADIVSPEHRPRRRPVSYDLLFSRFAEWGDEALAYAQQVKARKRCGRAQLVAILDLQRAYAADDIVAAIAHATRYRAFDAGALTRILETSATPRSLEDQFADRIRQRIRETMANATIQQRPIEDYARVLGSASGTESGTETDDGPHDDAEPTR